VKTYGDTVPNDRFYVHNRTRPPKVDVGAWRLEVTGNAVAHPRSFTYDELLALPQLTLRRVLDCGANCRAFFPKLPRSGTGTRWLPIGFTQWHFGAVGAADWTGVRLSDVLAAAGIDRAIDVKLTGLDSIPVERTRYPYEQVIPIDKVLASDTLLVHRMNGDVLPIDHGYPVRVIFSGWGGNTAVKWLGRIEVSKEKLAHPWSQANQLIFGPDIPKPYIQTMGHVRSAIELDADVMLDPGDLLLRGRAWSGVGAIDRVDVSLEQLVAPGTWAPAWHPPWREAEFLAKPEPLQWVRFEVRWLGAVPGRYRLMSRARDAAGNTQPRPEDVVWNQQGLGYNGHAPLEISVLPPQIMS
jgi:DMSO/TMAO reductase YedYZ molybdopterin-dependent catalytic subunit